MVIGECARLATGQPGKDVGTCAAIPSNARVANAFIPNVETARAGPTGGVINVCHGVSAVEIPDKVGLLRPTSHPSPYGCRVQQLEGEIQARPDAPVTVNLLHANGG